MDTIGVFLILLILSPLFILITHSLLVRVLAALRVTVQPLKTGALAVAVTFIWLAPLAWLFFLRTLETGLGAAALYGVLVYCCLAFCYFQVFAMTETARRLHILHELYTKGDMTLSQLDSAYGADQMMSIRLARMVEIHQLSYDGAHYRVCGNFLLFVGRIMSFWAKVLGYRNP